VAAGLFAIERLAGRWLVSAGLSAMAGRDVVVHGAARLRPGFPPRLVMHDVELTASSQGSVLDQARVARLEAAIELWPLLLGDVRIHHLLLRDARLSVGAGGDGPVAVIDELELRSRGEEGVVEAHAAGRLEHAGFTLDARRGEAVDGRSSLSVAGEIAGAKVSGAGSVDASGSLPDLDLQIEAQAEHLAILASALQRELPELGPVSAKAHLKLHDGRLGLSDIDLRVGNRDEAWLELSGSVGDLSGRQHFALRADFGITDVHALGPLVGDPPDIGSITGHLTVHDRSGHPGVEEFEVVGGRAGVLEIDAEGRFDDVHGVDGLDARVDLKVRDLAVLGELFRVSLPALGPAEFSGQVEGKAGEVDTDGVRGRLGKTHFQGSFSAVFHEGARPRLLADLEIPRLHLDDLGIRPTPASSAPPDDVPRERAADRPPVFSREPFDLAPLRAVDARLTLRTGPVSGAAGPVLASQKLDATLEAGKLSVRSSAIGASGSTLTTELSLDATTSPAALELRGHAEEIRLEGIVEQFRDAAAYSGWVTAKLDLRSAGASPHALAAGLRGELVVSCEGGRIAVESATYLTRDVFRAIRRVGSGPESEALNCFFLRLEFRDGVGTVGPLLLDAEDLVVYGKGQVDLGRETVELVLVPRPRRRSPLSTAATVRVKGPLRDPNVQVDKASLVTSTAGAIVGSVATLSGARQVWSYLHGSEPSPCDRVLAEASGD
jgi:hypothetical protein